MTIQEWLGEDNTLGHDIWSRKYRFDNEDFDSWLNRVSGNDDDVKTLIKEKKFLFGGRILANRGLEKLGRKITLSNCYVVAPPEDNIESIFDCAKKLARTYSYGGGVGVDISKLAPKNARINNAAKQTSGSVSFMDLYSMTTDLIGQNGRRGALMISIDCNHPDLEEFIDIKTDLNKVNKANISIKLTNEFMDAVKNNRDFDLEYIRETTGEKIVKTVNAREMFRKMASTNWDFAEPGALFWDRIKTWNLLSNTKEFEFAGVNPCAEEPLPSGGSCLLGSINLSEFVVNPFTDTAKFDIESFKKTVNISVKALNNVLDEGLPLHPLEEQRNSVRDWRQIGLGVMGIADMLIKLGLKYGSEKSVSFCNNTALIMINEAIQASARLSIQYGAYPKCNINEVINTPFFIENTSGQTRELVEKYGLRNSQLLTIAPTGSLSTMIGISGGIEPIFANYYERRTTSLHGEDVSYKVYTPIVKQYMDAHSIKDDKDLPDYFITSQQIEYSDRIKMQSIWQSHIDASISSTVNLANDVTVEQVEDLYIKAWEHGLKGITIFRDGCKRLGILTTPTSKTTDHEIITPTEFKRGMIEEVPQGLTYRKYKLKTGCGNLYLFVGMDEADGKIYDCFTNTDGVGGCTVNTQANSRLLSAALRGGVPIEYIISQLNKSGTCPSFQYKRGKGEKLSAGKSCPSAIANVFQNIIDEFDLRDRDDLEEDKENSIAIEEIDEGDTCPECKGKVKHESGCMTCMECGWSKCN